MFFYGVSKKFFLANLTIAIATFLAVTQNFDPTVLISTAIGLYIGGNVMQKVKPKL